MFNWFKRKEKKVAPSNRALILTDTSKLSDIIERKITVQLPDVEINTWRNGAISIDSGESASFQMEPPSNDYELYNFWENQKKADLKRRFELPFFYLIEFRNKEFLTQIVNLLPTTFDHPIEYTFINDEKALIKYIKKHFKK